LKAEKDELRRIQAEMREEEKAQRDIDRALKEANDNESRFQRALDKARAELQQAQGAQVDRLTETIANLNDRLTEALQAKERAKSMAEMTKSGHVYVISNIGSFGEHTYKIGMTRRLDPMDRVHELGDASVPFSFDVHAMIYSENAPELEAKLHRQFAHKRVNLVNERKEFFQVTLDEISTIVRKQHATIEFVMDAEAREYRETLGRRSGASRAAS
jgi:multidrug efflux pump subunit AcrA (membrane-fusion protein)